MNCMKCGSAIRETSNFCPSCGAQSHQIRHGSNRRGLLIVVGAVVALIGLSAVFNWIRDTTSTSSTTSSQDAATPQPQPVDVRKPTQEEQNAQFSFALDLQRKYQQNGFDIDVTAGTYSRTLELTGDVFRDFDAREAIVHSLVGNKRNLCGIGIWTVAVGYSKGMLSSNVAKTISLGCPAEKAVYAAERARVPQSERDNLAKQLTVDDRIRVYADGTTLAFDSPTFYSLPTFRPQILHLVSGQKEQLCSRGFTRVQLRGKGQSKAFPLKCD